MSIEKNITQNPLVAAVFGMSVALTSAASSAKTVADFPDISWQTGTSSTQAFIGTGANSGADYRTSTAIIDASLKRGNGTGGFAANDTYSGINNLIAPTFSGGYSKIEGDDNNPNVLIVPAGGKAIVYPAGNGDEIVGEGNSRVVVDYKNHSGTMVIDTTKGTASHGVKFSGVDKHIGRSDANTTFIANGDTLEFQGGTKGDTVKLAAKGLVTYTESAAGTEPDLVVFPEGIVPSQITINGNEISFGTQGAKLVVDDGNSATADDLKNIEGFKIQSLGYPEKITLAQLKRAIDTAKMTRPDPANERNVCVGNTAAQAFTTANGTTCDTVDYTVSSPVTVTLGTDAAPGTGMAGTTAQGDTYGSPIKKVIGSSAVSSTYNQLKGSAADANILYGLGSRNLALIEPQDTVVGSSHINSGYMNWVDYRGGTAPVIVNRRDNTAFGGNAEGTAAFSINAIKLPNTNDTVVTKPGEKLASIQDFGGADNYYVLPGSDVTINDADGGNITVFEGNLSPLTAVVAGNSISFQDLENPNLKTTVTFADGIANAGKFRFKSLEKGNEIYYTYNDLIDMVDKGFDASYNATATNSGGESTHSDDFKIYGTDGGSNRSFTFSVTLPTTDTDGKCLDAAPVTQLGVYFNSQAGNSINSGSQQYNVDGSNGMRCVNVIKYDTHCENAAQMQCSVEQELVSP